MEISSAVNFKARLQRLIAYQDVFARNNLLAQRSCDQGLVSEIFFHKNKQTIECILFNII
jgi:hypothetical protein